MIPQCIDQGVGVIPWSPLARGLLAGNRTRAGERLTTRANTDAFGDSLYKQLDVDFDVVERLTEVAERPRRAERAGRAGVAAAAGPGVTAPIVGATKLGHLEDALAGRAARAERRGDRARSRSRTFRTRSRATLRGRKDGRRREQPSSTPAAASCACPTRIA